MSVTRQPPVPVPTLISPEEAYLVVLRESTRLSARRVPLMDAVGRPLAESVRSGQDCPPFRRAMMDGYAVSLGSAGHTIDVAGRQAAGATRSPHGVTPGQCVEIMTGAACPPGSEAIVPKERVERLGNRVRLPDAMAAGEHIAEPGSDCAAGEEILAAGDIVTPLAVGALASLGQREVVVHVPPRIAVIVTGAELVPSGGPLLSGQIYDSNGPLLSALITANGLCLSSCRMVVDNREAIFAAVEAACDADVIVLSGGASAGALDLVPDALAAWGATFLFRKVRQKPGKPLLMARRGEQLIFGLPGNPLACHFCCCRYVLAAARKMGGFGDAVSEGVGAISLPLRGEADRARFVPALVAPEADGSGSWHIGPLPGAGSADLFHAHQANAYVELPPTPNEFLPGSLLPFRFL